jgi:hypothetical protein
MVQPVMIGAHQRVSRESMADVGGTDDALIGGSGAMASVRLVSRAEV